MSSEWKFFQKLNLGSFFEHLKSVYCDSNGKFLISDIIGFYGLPIILGLLYWKLASIQTNLQSIYTSVAFLAGFVFSAFIVLINLIPKINELQKGPIKTAMRDNTKQLALISILVFLLGILIVFLSFLDSVINQTSFRHSECVGHIIRTMAVTAFFSMLMHLVIIAKRLFVILVTT